MKKWKKIIALLLAVAMLMAVAGCSSKPRDNESEQSQSQFENIQSSDPDSSADESDENAMRTVVDATGNEILVPAHPKAIVVIAPVLPNIMFALQGHMNNVIAISKSAYTGWEASLMKDLSPELEDVNTTIVGSSINMEELVAAEPDLVLCWVTSTDTISQLNDLGIPVATFKGATDLETLENLISMMGDVLNCQERAAELIEWYDEVEAYIDSKASEIEALSEDEKPRVLTLAHIEDLEVYATGVDAWITEKVGGQNIVLTGESAERSAPTMEEILVYNPDIIFLSNWDDSTPDDLYENRIEGQDWSNINAVKNHRVYKVPIGLYRWTPPNTVDKPLYYLYMASIIQPEIFSEIDMIQEEKDFIQKFFGVELSEEQLDYVFHADLYK
ncbi:MAG: ABC transporter substrate-binding protein [Oscillospiraceae bacterium]